MAHKVYEAIVKAVRSGAVHEPFSKDQFSLACPGLGAGTYNAFLDKHCRGNPGRNSELFDRVAPGLNNRLPAYLSHPRGAAEVGAVVQRTASRSAARARMRVESRIGSGESASAMSSGNSVQASATASHPRP